MIVGSFGPRRGSALVVAALVVLVLAAAWGPSRGTRRPATDGGVHPGDRAEARPPTRRRSWPSGGWAGRSPGPCRSSPGSPPPCPPPGPASWPASPGSGRSPPTPRCGSRPPPRRRHHPLGLPQDDQGRCRLEARGHRPRGHRGRARHRGGQRARPGRPAGPGAQRPHRPDHPCKNLSGELDCNDRYGHGTFIAGLVAGNGASSGGKWKGVAPEASVLSVKAAGADGAADVSNILAAIQWVVSFKDRYNIRVLNLSLGTDSTQDWRVDPLNYAVERAWAAGMTVVVAASNKAPAPGPSPSRPTTPGWSPSGPPTTAAPPGWATTSCPTSRAAGRPPTGWPSRTSPPPAPTSSPCGPPAAPSTPVPLVRRRVLPAGQRHLHGHRGGLGRGGADAPGQPRLHPRPGQARAGATARDAASSDPMAVGAGVVDVNAAAYSAPPGVANQGLARSNGQGSLGLSRGSVQVRPTTRSAPSSARSSGPP